MRDCVISCSGTTFGTAAGMLRYLVAMAAGTCRRDRPLPAADGSGATQLYRPHAAAAQCLAGCGGYALSPPCIICPRRRSASPADTVLIDGRPVPVLHQWQKHTCSRRSISASHRRFSSADGQPKPGGTTSTAQCGAVAICHRARDAGWLEAFSGQPAHYRLRRHRALHRAFDPVRGLRSCARHHCTAHAVPADEPRVGRRTSRISVSAGARSSWRHAEPQIDQVMLFDSRACGVPAQSIRRRDDRPVGIQRGRNPYRRIRIQRCTGSRISVRPTTRWLRCPIISSSILRGGVGVLRAFYRRLLAEYVGRAELLTVEKGIQGAINLVCHSGGLSFPMTIHPNGAEVLFRDTGHPRLPVTARTCRPGVAARCRRSIYGPARWRRKSRRALLR